MKGFQVCQIIMQEWAAQARTTAQKKQVMNSAMQASTLAKMTCSLYSSGNCTGARRQPCLRLKQLTMSIICSDLATWDHPLRLSNTGRASDSHHEHNIHRQAEGQRIYLLYVCLTSLSHKPPSCSVLAGTSLC